MELDENNLHQIPPIEDIGNLTADDPKLEGATTSNITTPLPLITKRGPEQSSPSFFTRWSGIASQMLNPSLKEPLQALPPPPSRNIGSGEDHFNPQYYHNMEMGLAWHNLQTMR
ncbi:hypothetical protein JCGZ_05169 [Jatropha curcas]|uniref:Uncharacterized protein n=1 Tax=Jatropha curcas TaxID=180498 RepID=A0A067KTK9_JATCU|nr:hypothetical protein JCGZ_05169 [Jatropha curcas]